MVDNSIAVAVIMPAYNEEENVEKAVAKVGEVLQRLGLTYEIIVVDDGSTDHTREKASGLSSKDQRIRVVGFSRNRGKGVAITYGCKHARGDTVVLTDCDSEIDLTTLGRYVEALKYADIAIASKRHPESVYRAPLMRKVLSYGFNLLVMLLTDIRVSDSQTGLKAARRLSLNKILGLISVKRYAFDVELLTIASLWKMRIVELPVRIELRARFSPSQVFRMLIDLLGIGYRLRVRKWYQSNLNHPKPRYEPIIRW